MPISISRLFKSKASVKDGLTQSQREAIADLLHYCMYADNHIALAETQVISDLVSTFEWDPKIAFETFEERSVGSARAARESDAQRQAFLDSIKQRLNTPRSRSLALTVCQQLFCADGVAPSESAMLARIEQLLA